MRITGNYGRDLVVIGFEMIRSANLLWEVNTDLLVWAGSVTGGWMQNLGGPFEVMTFDIVTWGWGCPGEGGGSFLPPPARGGGWNIADVGGLFFFNCVPDWSWYDCSGNFLDSDFLAPSPFLLAACWLLRGLGGGGALGDQVDMEGGGGAMEWQWNGSGMAMEWKWNGSGWQWNDNGVALEWKLSGSWVEIEIGNWKCWKDFLTKIFQLFEFGKSMKNSGLKCRLLY